VVVAVLVVVGLIFGIASLFRGSSDEGATDAGGTADTPCVTTTVTAAQVLPEPNAVTVNVYNSTPKSGLAMDTAKELKARKFLIGKVANDPRRSGSRAWPRSDTAEGRAVSPAAALPRGRARETGRRTRRSSCDRNTYSGLAPQQDRCLMASPRPTAGLSVAAVAHDR
jgi:hypothetical protein